MVDWAAPIQNGLNLSWGTAKLDAGLTAWRGPPLGSSRQPHRRNGNGGFVSFTHLCVTLARMDRFTVSESSQKTNDLRDRSSDSIAPTEPPTREPVLQLFGEFSGIEGREMLDGGGPTGHTHTGLALPR
jgi:hypothetical protein